MVINSDAAKKSNWKTLHTIEKYTIICFILQTCIFERDLLDLWETASIFYTVLYLLRNGINDQWSVEVETKVITWNMFCKINCYISPIKNEFWYFFVLKFMKYNWLIKFSFYYCTNSYAIFHLRKQIPLWCSCFGSQISLERILTFN